MATIVLQAAGAALGNAIGGPIGAVIGRTAGAIAGSYIDQQLFGPGDRVVDGPRLERSQYLSSDEGSVIARIYGTARVSGQVIWATRFLEVRSTNTEKQGGKGSGPKTTVTSYAYFANFALGLCEGEIARIGRIWADGKLQRNEDFTIRVHRGTEDQLPDSLIEAKQGAGNAPAYRGLAYAVFENFPLEAFGNRIPQISIEVIRPVGDLHRRIRAVNIIPGATEFGYDPTPVIERTGTTSSRRLNTHTSVASTDWNASIDELQAVCPNLQRASLVVAWFGDDLRAGECTIRPKVEVQNRNITDGEGWRVAGQTRQSAPVVSQTGSGAAYGGTPSDGSVIRAIQDLKARGLDVTFNPFVMMDVPAGNGLPDPYGGAEQAAYPWRGRITCMPSIGQPGSVWNSAAAADQIAAFAGKAAPGDFAVSGSTVEYLGSEEWSYRRMILHYAHLCAAAGGIDMFLLGSELRGLTRIRDGEGNFPFVDVLRDLAADVRSILGPNVRITYGADWSEFFGYQPAGSSDVFFNLDPLWADDNIAAIAIDNYMPLSDWRAGGSPDGAGRSANDVAMLSSMVATGEGFDWYYASEADRISGQRTEITDGQGEAWIYRYKDLVSWWSNAHHERIDGVRNSSPTDWVPGSKPFYFSEIGCPAIHNGAAQPNLFVDPKSSENGVPWFSNGNRDDAAQSAFLLAHYGHWDHTAAGFDEAKNPSAQLFSGRMVDVDYMYLWAWDARPFPAFPDAVDVWSDGGNWSRGHWLNGRLGAVRIADLIAAMLEESGFADFDVSGVDGMVDGYVLAEHTSPRRALESLLSLYRIQSFEQDGALVFRSPGVDDPISISAGGIAESDEDPVISLNRGQETDLPNSATLLHIDPRLEFRSSATQSRRIESGSAREVELNAPIVIEQSVVATVVESWLQATWNARDTLVITLPKRLMQVVPGDELVLPDHFPEQRWQVVQIEDGIALKVTARAVEPLIEQASRTPSRSRVTVVQPDYGRPAVSFLSLPFLGNQEQGSGNRIAVAAQPWPGPMAASIDSGTNEFTFLQTVDLPATTGVLGAELAPGVVSRWDRAGEIDVVLDGESLAAVSPGRVLNGANAAAIRKPGGWEVVQFEKAELIGSRRYLLRNLLRGQAGTEPEAAEIAGAGSQFVLLDAAVEPLQLGATDFGVERDWLVGPVGETPGNEYFTRTAFAPGAMHLRPYRPVHMRLDIHDNGDASISWIRRDRLRSDSWQLVEIPMSEEAEEYRIAIKDGAATLRSWHTEVPKAEYLAADIAADAASASGPLTIEVAQISALTGAGPAAAISLA